MTGADVSEMLQLYREASADLARLQTASADPGLVREVNRLVTRAHGQIYRGVGRRRYGSLLTFLLVGYPLLFRATWRFTLASFLLSLSFAVMAYVTVQRHPDIVSDILGGAEEEFRGRKTAEGFQDRFRRVSSPELSSLVTTNNIIVALNAFALGVTFGVGTAYVLIVNGSMVGGFAGACAHSGVGTDFWMIVLTHGALELSAIVIAGGAGLMVGYALWCPGGRTRRRALREEAARAAKLALGLIPAFIVAGFLEGFVTPNTDLPQVLKAGLGILVALVYWLYLFFGGRGAVPALSANGGAVAMPTPGYSR